MTAPILSWDGKPMSDDDLEYAVRHAGAAGDLPRGGPVQGQLWPRLASLSAVTW